MRILAVDDEPYIRELMPMMAARVGFPDVTTVASGAHALDSLSEAVFDCIILDINMPEMDGIELCRRIRALPAYRQTPVLMLTAMSERDFMVQAFKAGATDYVTKPFDIHELGARLRIAEELMLARRAAADPAIAPVNLAEALILDGVDRLIDFTAFKNYLKQASRAGLAATHVVAVQIDRIETLFGRANQNEFLYGLREVAFALTEALRLQGCLISYAGHGVFAVVCNSAAPMPADVVESDVQQILDERDAAYDDGTPMDLEVSVGAPIHPNYGDLSEVPRSVERAIARAENRSATKRSKLPTANLRNP